jgi:CBS domain-containing protein
VEPQETLDRAVQLMAAYDVTHVIVVENDYPVGIVSTLDVARAVGGV